MPDEIKTEAPKKEPMQLPVVESPYMQYNRENRVFWLGIPVDKYSALDLLLIMDSVKADLIGAHKEALTAKQHTVKPAGRSINQALQNTKNFLFGKK